MRCYWTRFSIERSSGYHLFFRTAIAGGLLSTLSFLLLFLLTELWISCACPWCDAPPLSELVSVSPYISILPGIILPPIINFFYGREKAARKAAEENGDFIELLLADSELFSTKATKSRNYVELSLKSGKSYIGLALNSGLHTQRESDIIFLPFISGHRDPNTQNLNLTTYYAPVIQQMIKSGIIQEKDRDNYFQLVIPLSEIVSARFFDLTAYQHFQDAAES